jgi:Thioredoxin domain
MDTIKIEILGTGWKKCQQLETNAKEAVANLNLMAEVLHITEPSRDCDARGDVYTSNGD